MDLSALSHTLKPLTRDGLVTITTDPHDRRAKRALLTEIGMAKFSEAQRLWLGAQRRFEATLGDERAAELRSVLGFIASEDFAQTYLDG
jgi:DNA-binding MarR family transcriptional regulator